MSDDTILEKYEELHKENLEIKEDVSTIKIGLQERGIINNAQNEKIKTIEESYREGDELLREDLRDWRDEQRSTREMQLDLSRQMTALTGEVATCTATLKNFEKQQKEKKEADRFVSTRRLAIIAIVVAVGIGIMTFLPGLFGMNNAHMPSWLQPLVSLLGGA